ncbi:unnamed protein product [Thelazia callipaeda]|uniref:ABC transmembrane type-1 domain-containing protein n=1 Tax=Thelazia callipaeda TaxID=103827 RepID=A0A0N5CS12_THECL|nr:unnamed protein product [Thelazia callipaeda]
MLQSSVLKKFAKRLKAEDTYFEQNMLHESKVYLDVKEKYLVLKQKAQGREIDRTKWTRKVIFEHLSTPLLATWFVGFQFYGRLRNHSAKMLAPDLGTLAVCSFIPFT